MRDERKHCFSRFNNTAVEARPRHKLFQRTRLIGVFSTSSLESSPHLEDKNKKKGDIYGLNTFTAQMLFLVGISQR